MKQMKFTELYDRTKIEIENILTAVRLNGIEEYSNIERLPSMTGVGDLYKYIKAILGNGTIWYNLISCIHVNQKDSAHTWNPEKSKTELKDILTYLVKIMLKSKRYEAKNKTIGTGANTNPNGSTGIWDNWDNKFVSETEKIKTIDMEHHPAFDGCYLQKQMDIGTTFQIGNIHPIKIIFVVDGKAFPENGYTNPSHIYEIIRIQDNIIHCEVCGQTDDTYYAIDRDLVERYL